MNFSFIWIPVVYILILALPLSISDFQQHRLPNPMTISAIIITLCALVIESFRQGQFVSLIWGLAAGLTTFLLGYLLAKREAIGMGDVKLLTSMHLLAGFVSPILPLMTLTLGLVIATLISLIRVFRGRIDMKSAIPLGPYLLIGFFSLMVPAAWSFTEAA